MSPPYRQTCYHGYRTRACQDKQGAYTATTHNTSKPLSCQHVGFGDTAKNHVSFWLGGLGRWAEDLPKKHAPKLQIPFFSISLLSRLLNPGSWYEWFVDRSKVDSSTCSTNRRNVNNEAPHMFSASTPTHSKAAQANVNGAA
jgi:hypothetical protein